MLVQSHYEFDIRVMRKAEALVAAGFSVDVLSLASENAKSKDFTLNGVNVSTLSLGKQRGSLARYLYEYAAFFLWCFFRLLFSFGKRYDIIDVNNLPDFLVFAALPAKVRGAKVVFDMHEITPEFYMSKYKIGEDSLVIHFLKGIERMSFNFADHVMTINESIDRLLISRGLTPGKSTIVMNAVDEALFTAAEGSAQNANAMPQPKFLMMYHGTLTGIYGLDIAIEAFGKAHAQMPGAEFWILGRGPEKAALESLCEKLGIAGKVKFIGNVRPQEVPHWLKRCDIGVLATRRDIFLDYSYSNKLSEYIIMDKAVIASRLKAINHYFNDSALAYFEPNDPSDLARQMARVYSDETLRRQLAANARQQYQPISWPVMKDRYLTMMKKLVDWDDATAPKPAVGRAVLMGH